MTEIILQLEDVHKVFNPTSHNEKHILKGINLQVKAGDFITIIGGNGAGKSTLLNSIAGTYPINKGNITLDGQSIDSWPEEKSARYISRVFQDPLKGTAPRMTVAENLALAYRRGEKRSLKKILDKDLIEKFEGLLSSVGLNLAHRLHDEVGLLSGGQRQTVAMIMATLKTPRLLLLDEHVAALDPKASAKVMALTQDRVAKDQLTSLMITHNMKHAIEHGNRLIMMDRGRIIYDVSGEEKAALTVERLLHRFQQLGSEEALTDKMLLESRP